MQNYIWGVTICCAYFPATCFSTSWSLQFLSVKRDWKGILWAWKRRQTKHFLVNYLTWAAGGFHGCQRPNNDHISLCNALWCCTLGSKCSQVLGSACARFPRNPRNKGYLFVINENISSDRQQITTQQDGSAGYSWEMMVYTFQTRHPLSQTLHKWVGKRQFPWKDAPPSVSQHHCWLTDKFKVKAFYGEIEFILLGQIPKGNQLLYNYFLCLW